MAYARINKGKVTLNKLGLEVNEGSYFVASKLEDLKNLKYDNVTCPVGSVCLVLGYQESNNTFGDSDNVNEGGGKGASSAYFMSPEKIWVRFDGVTNIVS